MATILAQQWNMKNGEISFRPYNFKKPYAKREDSSLPDSYFGKQRPVTNFLRSYIGGAAIDHADRAEPGARLDIEYLFLNRLKQQT